MGDGRLGDLLECCWWWVSCSSTWSSSREGGEGVEDGGVKKEKGRGWLLMIWVMGRGWVCVGVFVSPRLCWRFHPHSAPRACAHRVPARGSTATPESQSRSHASADVFSLTLGIHVDGV